MCSLRFEDNFLAIGHVRFRFENSARIYIQVVFNTTDSHILGWADGTQTWNNVESCAKMFAEMSKRLHNVREKLIKICK